MSAIPSSGNMAVPASRRRASTVTYSQADAIELRAQLAKLSDKDGRLETPGSLEDTHVKIHAALSIRQHLLESQTPYQTKDAFRQLNGFEAIVRIIQGASLCLSTPNIPQEESRSLSDLLQSILGLLTAALHDHWGNRKYFRTKADGGGWIAVRDAIRTKLFSDPAKQHGFDKNHVQRLFGCLLACSVNDESLTGFFIKLGRHVESELPHWANSDAAARQHDQPSTLSGQVQVQVQDVGPKTISLTTQTLQKALGAHVLLSNPEVIPIMLDLWMAVIRNLKADDGSFDPILLTLPSIINQIASSSTHNLIAVHSTDTLGMILQYLLNSSLNSIQLSDLQSLAVSLLELGVTALSDAYFLYRNASSSRIFAELLHSALTKSHTPAYVHFDLSLHGFASIELPDIGRPFPPLSSSAGYSLSIWLYVVEYDPESHTTLFGAFDSSQTCFVLVYLEKDTRNLILQTSVTSSKPSVRFKSFSFEEKRWYHVCVVHRRPKTTSSSRASLFVDGEFVEQVKSNYPSPPPSISSSEISETLSSGRKYIPVQAFLGTPRDLASRLGPGLVSSQWRLASAHLFDDTLSDDLIAVYRQLGPRYHGNFQDCLGSFQTYKASAALNLRNEYLHPGKEEKSDIVTAIRLKAGSLLPEGKIIMNISPMVVLDDDERNNIDETQLIKSLSKNASKTLRNATRGGKTVIAINGSIPSINEALLHSCGFAVLTGDPVIAVPQSLDYAAWRIGGCAAVGLSLFESAQSPKSILLAFDILLESITESWRNSEAMERENGFGVLATLIASKLWAAPSSTSNEISPNATIANSHELGQLAFDILTRILAFLGYRVDNPEDSVINNPLAYRILLVDLDVWRTLGPTVQKLYYEQFTVFISRSKYHNFNSKRLSRMRIVKRWLDALKGEVFYVETFDYFLKAFRALLTSNPSTENLRSLALFITYAVHNPKPHGPQALRPSKSAFQLKQTSQISRRSTLSSAATNHPQQRHSEARSLSRVQVGVRILEMYTELLCHKDTANVKKFARTVTNKWLLHLLADDEPTVVVFAIKILARVLVVMGPSYQNKFTEKTGGFIIIRHRMRRWWNEPPVWPICFAIMFDRDVADVDFERPFDLYSLLETFGTSKRNHPINSGVLPVIISLLQNGLRSIMQDQENFGSSPSIKGGGAERTESENSSNSTPSRSRSMSLNLEFGQTRKATSQRQRLEESASTLRTVIRFLADIHSKSQIFRDFAITSSYVQELLFVLFPIVVSSDAISPETELHSRESSLTFNGNDVIIRPLSQTSTKSASIVRTTPVETNASPRASKAQPLRRGSSYILVTSERSEYQPSKARLHSAMSPTTKLSIAVDVSNSVVEELLEIVIAVFSDQVFSRKDFPGIGLFMKVPSGFQEHQAYFESYVLRNTISHLHNSIQLDQKLLWEPRVLTNLVRFAGHLGEAVYEGWFIDGAGPVLDFLGYCLEYVQRPDIVQLKTVRLCSQAVSGIRTVVLRIVLLRLSELDEGIQEVETVSFLHKLTYWQTVVLASQDSQVEFLNLLCYLLYGKLMSTHHEVRTTAANLWRILLVQKPNETSAILHQMMTVDDDHLSDGFRKIVELDNESFLNWIDAHRTELDAIFFGEIAKIWEAFVNTENRKTEEASQARINRRREKLRIWSADDMRTEDIVRRHEISSDHWRSNIYASEHLKRQRTSQDQQDNVLFNASTWMKMQRDIHRCCGLLDEGSAPKWLLDQTEGRNRMRLRLIPDYDAHLHTYQTKQQSTHSSNKRRISLSDRSKTSTPASSPSPIRLDNPTHTANEQPSSILETSSSTKEAEEIPEPEDGFEMVENPRDDIDAYEDKNRKVMRSLQRGDQVEHVHNVSRIIGLEACEGLLILGKDALYLLDNFFQRSDGEIVNVWQAPHEERDPYLQMIAGRESGAQTTRHPHTERETHSWRWEDVSSISKRRFLFRDVAIELFFADGRSYLLTVASPSLRDELHQRLLNKSSNLADGAPSMTAGDPWRLESLTGSHGSQQTFGFRFANPFSQSISSPVTKSWLKGELSNFHYLMHVNTMAGRTFNDLTQYPVFPWVLADYTSEELDLTDPKSFRDLTKPMGCQTKERQAEFIERYLSFAEMSDGTSPPFHYGTHYSSAMIVTSYLIRLQPFVQSYLLLQGGNFDHPDRLFFSIEKAWTSASRDNMTDVRELIPEFYYMPEFLENINGYNFGARQGTGGVIDNVALPPWAKGDPKVFVEKHREALESEYVSRNLHHWIDLVFGHKQRGEAALEATNVFHHLSYHGAKDLDTIHDPIERLATIGIIHNFGQTPHQVFQRVHPQREEARHKVRRMDSLAETLTPLPFPLLETQERISSLLFSRKHDRLFCSGAFRLNIPPTYDKYMQWGFIDGSLRFYATDTKKLLGLFEHVHQGQLSDAVFADSKTLITAGTDCTVSVWAIVSTAKSVDLQPRACFFGHKSPVTELAVSRSFSALLSASSDGQVILWDLNRLAFVRELSRGIPVECARINDVTGNVMVCRGPNLALFTLNGAFLLEHAVCAEDNATVSSCAFYEGQGNEYLERNLIFTGHHHGVVRVWNKSIRRGRFVLEHIISLNHIEATRLNTRAAISCILPMAQILYTGDEDGRVYEWDCIQRQGGESAT